MGRAVRNRTTGWIGGWSRYDTPAHDPQTEEIVECEVEDLEGMKPAAQIDDEAAPLECTPMQAEIALHRAGFLPAVLQVIEAAGPEAQIAWRKATVIRRKSPLVESLAAAVPGLVEALPAIFTAAVQIEV